MENDYYVYGESEFIVEDYFQKKELLDFANRLGYVTGIVPSYEADKKHQKNLIDVSLLIGTHSREGRRISFGKLKIFFTLHCWFPFVVLILE